MTTARDVMMPGAPRRRAMPSSGARRFRRGPEGERRGPDRLRADMACVVLTNRQEQDRRAQVYQLERAAGCEAGGTETIEHARAGT